MKKIIALILTLALALALTVSLASCTDDAESCYAEIKVKDYGTIVVYLDAQAAPITVENFVTLANEGFYDGLTFHRVVENFMIQGGDPNGNGSGSSPNKIKGEFSANGYDNPISHTRGTISMARRSDSYDSASCQFFICNADASGSLDGQYAAFGHVVSGMDVVDAITESTAPYTTTIPASFLSNRESR
ncbi:MAG: peptidylprolyl isomerase [Clostridia bacterium]|nr:peptidylprolyl isomerase [Clostridia bacterium]